MDLKSKIRTIPDWPKKGIMFRDITPLLQDKKAFKYVIDKFYERYKGKNIGVIVAIESRGFIFGSTLAYKLECSFVPVRKEGKLPHKTMKQEYTLEYGTSAVEIHEDAIKQGQNVLIVDDLIATSGTALATIKLVELLGGKVVECAFVVELIDLKGREKLKDYNVFSLVEFEGE
ncbi:MAG: adenine phosphoribosyltransferase [Candidatus Woesearchaeota archaeon]|jgi:adenine phosphoribosyltransferase|nr:adenine phosphoribosyltransferase [Candidatus Woesearchaeota archaeon]|tara:strand:+ start:6438 stop:6959 length:522 start_codon:yes stop_codon:yes gene_type:complete